MYTRNNGLFRLRFFGKPAKSALRLKMTLSFPESDRICIILHKPAGQANPSLPKRGGAACTKDISRVYGGRNSRAAVRHTAGALSGGLCRVLSAVCSAELRPSAGFLLRSNIIPYYKGDVNRVHIILRFSGLSIILRYGGFFADARKRCMPEKSANHADAGGTEPVRTAA